jgi:hypothetical protein
MPPAVTGLTSRGRIVLDPPAAVRAASTCAAIARDSATFKIGLLAPMPDARATRKSALPFVSPRRSLMEGGGTGVRGVTRKPLLLRRAGPHAATHSEPRRVMNEVSNLPVSADDGLPGVCTMRAPMGVCASLACPNVMRRSPARGPACLYGTGCCAGGGWKRPLMRASKPPACSGVTAVDTPKTFDVGGKLCVGGF